MDDENLVTLAERCISPIGFGCGPLGVHGFGQVDQIECRKAVLMALDEGVSLFDTSDAYGRGVSEEQLALALGKRRQEAFITTKGGIRFGAGSKVYYDSSPAYLRLALENSLRRLKTDYVELYQLHYWDGTTPIEEIFTGLEEMVEAGKIGNYGVSNLDLSRRDVSFFSEFSHFISHSDELNMVRQDKLTSVRKMEEKREGVVFLATGVLAQGLLSGKYKAGAKFGENDRRAKSNYSSFDFNFMRKAEKLINLLTSSELPSVALATAWVIKKSPKVIALTGVKSRQQLKEVLKALELLKGDVFWDEIEQEVSGFQNAE